MLEVNHYIFRIIKLEILINSVKKIKKLVSAIQNSIIDWKAKKEKRLNKDSDGEEEEEENIYAVIEVKFSIYLLSNLFIYLLYL